MSEAFKTREEFLLAALTAIPSERNHAAAQKCLGGSAEMRGGILGWWGTSGVRFND